MNLLAMLSECIGTFLLVVAILFTGHWLIIGLTLAGVIYISGNISGGHMNPAVSIVMFLKGSMDASECIAYSFSQILGAVIALVAFKSFT
jgi:aquaporin Z